MQNKILICGEAFGRQEEEAGQPFVGAAGFLLSQVLAQNGIEKKDCYLTNVFNFHLAGGDIKSITVSDKRAAIVGIPKHPSGWISNEYTHELTRLKKEIATIKPNLILALGGTASWFFLQDSRISKVRGASVQTEFGKVLCSYHPAAVLRDYSLRPILTADCAKAAREQEYPDVRRLRRFVHIEPSLSDILSFHETFIEPSLVLSTDIETISNQITCIGLAPTKDRAIVIPFYDPTKPGGNYWSTLEEELKVWDYLRKLFRSPRINVGQNFMYDAGFLWRSYGIPVHGMINGDDTMLMHHALQPELQKGLAFLGSIYTDEAAWKMERKNTSVKKED